MGTRRTAVYKTEEGKKGKAAAVVLSKKSLAPEEPQGEEAAGAQAVPKKTRRKKSPRGRNYKKKADLLRKEKLYPAKEAVALVKKTSYARFDAAVEAHFRLGIDPKKQPLRANCLLPHGTGRKIRVLVFSRQPVKGADRQGDEKTLAEISEGKLVPKRDFDAVVAAPDWMPKLAKTAKILGPKGMMPNPKAGTVSHQPEKAVAQLKSGQMVLKSEANAPLVHTVLGKVSFKDEQLLENLTTVVAALKSARPPKVKGVYLQSLTLSATMGPGIKVDLPQLAK